MEGPGSTPPDSFRDPLLSPSPSSLPAIPPSPLSNNASAPSNLSSQLPKDTQQQQNRSSQQQLQHQQHDSATPPASLPLAPGFNRSETPPASSPKSRRSQTLTASVGDEKRNSIASLPDAVGDTFCKCSVWLLVRHCVKFIMRKWFCRASCS